MVVEGINGVHGTDMAAHVKSVGEAIKPPRDTHNAGSIAGLCTQPLIGSQKQQPPSAVLLDAPPDVVVLPAVVVLPDVVVLPAVVVVQLIADTQLESTDQVPPFKAHWLAVTPACTFTKPSPSQVQQLPSCPLVVVVAAPQPPF